MKVFGKCQLMLSWLLECFGAQNFFQCALVAGEKGTWEQMFLIPAFTTTALYFPYKLVLYVAIS